MSVYEKYNVASIYIYSVPSFPDSGGRGAVLRRRHTPVRRPVLAMQDIVKHQPVRVWVRLWDVVGFVLPLYDGVDVVSLILTQFSALDETHLRPRRRAPQADE